MQILKPLFGAAVAALLMTACSGGGNGGADLVAGGPAPGGGNTGGGDTGDTGGPGSGTGLDGGISGSGRVVGTLDGFGSIILNDLELESGSATILVEGEAALESDLRVGYVLDVGADLDESLAESIHYRAALIGPVTFGVQILDLDLGEAVLQVLGQTVVVNGTTVFAGSSLGVLAPGDVIEVSGLPDADGRLVATYLGITQSSIYKVVGIAQDVTADTFGIGGLTVETDGADLVGFGGAALAGNDVVEVRVEPAGVIGDDRVAALEVELLGVVGFETGIEIELEGFIDRFVDVTDFSVTGQPVTTTATTTFENGSAQDVRLNAKVEISGTTDAEGAIVASEVEIESVESVRVVGVITEVDPDLETITVLDVVLAIRAETDLEDDGDADVDPLRFADLQPGDYIESRGFWSGATVVLRRLERDDVDEEARLRGPVTRIDATSGEIDILSATIVVGPATEFENDDGGGVDRAAFFASLAVGDFIDARWDVFVGIESPVDRVSVEEDD